jgi:uncharacterized protein YutE (UPF0331/DUF86 family)
MVERDVIIRIFTNLDEYLRDLEELKKSSTLQDFVTNKITRRYAERTLQLAVEACLDLAQHIISYQGFREPLDNKDCFQVLYEEGITSQSLADRLKKMTQFRNVVVHDYIKIDPEIVFAIIQKDLGDITAFIKAIKEKYLPE